MITDNHLRTTPQNSEQRLSPAIPYSVSTPLNWENKILSL